MKNKLELWVAEQLKPIDPKARPTKASGASTEIGDVINKYFYIQCKERNIKHIIIDRNEWNKLCSQIANINKLPIYINENKYKEKFVTMDATDFFRMFKQFLRDIKILEDSL